MRSRLAKAVPAGKIPLLLLLILCAPARCRSEISECSGPRGEVYFTDRECPPGFSLKASTPSTPASPVAAPSNAEGDLTAPTPPSEDQEPPVPPEKKSPGDPVCREGTFVTENHISSYEVFFTNTSRSECRQIKAYCLCSLSFGAYKQSEVINIAGTFAPGARVRITSIATTGPGGRDIDWSWCKFK